MKNIFFAFAMLFSMNAFADLFSLECGDKKNDSAQVQFSGEIGSDGVSDSGLYFYGKEVKGTTFVLSGDNVIATPPAPNNGHQYKQYIFSLQTKSGDCTGHLNIYLVGANKGRQHLEKLDCECSTD